MVEIEHAEIVTMQVDEIMRGTASTLREFEHVRVRLFYIEWRLLDQRCRLLCLFLFSLHARVRARIRGMKLAASVTR